LKKFAWKPILDAVNDREEESKRITFCWKCKKMQNLQADNNVFYKKQEWSVITC
jgi:F-type H+-transporting ATPase subunit b